MSLLAAYDRARTALAEACQVSEVVAIAAELEHVKLYARQIQDRKLLADATAWQMRFERRLGELLEEGRRAGLIASKGGDRKSADAPKPATLAEIGVEKQLAVRAAKSFALEAEAFEALLEVTANKIRSGRAVIVDEDVINGARAVMGSRQEPDDSLDYFPTPPWATRALIEHVFPVLNVHAPRHSAAEPACGEGHIAEVLEEYFAKVLAGDIFEYGYSDTIADFLHPSFSIDVDWIITNPPFGDAGEAFVHKALELATEGIAMFMRVQWLDSIGRYERVFRDKPPTLIAFFAERVNLCKGRWDPEGGTATAYMWLIWKHGTRPRAPFWIPPGCREQLAHPDDIARFTTHPVTKRIQEAA